MSDNDLIRRRDVDEILLDQGWYGNTMQRVDALPPAVLAELPEVRALVAAALQRAADGPLIAQIWAHYGDTKKARAAILALIDTDHAAALEAVKAQAWNDALDWAAGEADEHKLFAKGIECCGDCIRAGKVQP